MELGVPELLVILVIVIVLFGPGRFGKILGELGTGIRSFKDSIEGADEKKPDVPAAPAVSTTPSLPSENSSESTPPVDGK